MNAGEIRYELMELKAMWQQFQGTAQRKGIEAEQDGYSTEAVREQAMVKALGHCIAALEDLLRRIDGQ